MDVYLKKGVRLMKGKDILIGGAVAGTIAIACALAIATTRKKAEKKK